MGKITKSDAIREANRRLGNDLLKGSNTTAVNLNSETLLWWININRTKLGQERYVLLAHDCSLILLRIPPNQLKLHESEFKTIHDGRQLNIAISARRDKLYMRDKIGTGYDFSQHVIDRWTWQDITMTFTVETEQEVDGRWIGAVPQIPGALVYGTTPQDAIAKVKALALRIIADRIEHGEVAPELLEVTFKAA